MFISVTLCFYLCYIFVCSCTCFCSFFHCHCGLLFLLMLHVLFSMLCLFVFLQFEEKRVGLVVLVCNSNWLIRLLDKNHGIRGLVNNVDFYPVMAEFSPALRYWTITNYVRLCCIFIIVIFVSYSSHSIHSLYICLYLRQADAVVEMIGYPSYVLKPVELDKKYKEVRVFTCLNKGLCEV
mgnify:CR=1 FL=1